MSGLRAALVVAILLTSGAEAIAAPPQSGGDSWSAEADGFRFFYGGSASDGTYLYIFAGEQALKAEGSLLTSDLRYDLLRRYDPLNNSWSTLQAMPAAAFLNGGAYHDGRLFSFGGTNSEGIADGAIHVYTISTNSWTTLEAKLGNKRVMAQTATLGTKIYITGGFNGTNTPGILGAASNLHEEFDPANGTLAARANPPAITGVIQWQATAAVPSLNKLYAFGFRSQSEGNILTYEYTPSDDTWAARMTAPDDGTGNLANFAYVAFTIGDRIYINGGNFFGGNFQKSTWEYTPATNSWARRTDMNIARFAHGAAVINGKGYVYGGLQTRTTGEEYTPPNYNQPPVANAGVDRTLECTGSPGTSVVLNGSASMDPNGDTLSYAWTGSFGTATGVNPGVSLALGAHAITLKVTDPSGANSSDSVTITIVDTTAPMLLNMPAPKTVEQANLNGTAVSLSVPTASDICDPAPTVTSNAPAIFPLGQTTVTFKATDASGLQSTATATVTVRDTTSPSISAPPSGSYPQDSTIQLGSPTVSDICDASITVTSNAPNSFGLGQTVVTWSATDDSGNSATATQTVTVFTLGGLGSNVIVGPGVTFGQGVVLKDGAKVGANVTVGSDVTIKENASIGAGSTIGAGAVIKENAVVGSGSKVGSNATIKAGVQVGTNVRIGVGVVLEDGVVIGNGSAIGDNTKIKEGAVLGMETRIGKDCVIGAVQIGAGASVGDSQNITSNVAAGQSVGGTPTPPTIP